MLLSRPLFKVKAKTIYLLLCHYAEQGSRGDNGRLRIRKQEEEGWEIAKRRVKLPKLQEKKLRPIFFFKTNYQVLE